MNDIPRHVRLSDSKFAALVRNQASVVKKFSGAQMVPSTPPPPTPIVTSVNLADNHCTTDVSRPYDMRTGDERNDSGGNSCPENGDGQFHINHTVPSGNFYDQLKLSGKYNNNNETLLKPLVVVASEHIQANYSYPVPTQGSKIDINAFLIRAVQAQKPQWSSEKCAEYIKDLPKGSAEFAAVEETARKLIWDSGRLGAHPWNHIVHARLYDVRNAFYDPRFHEPRMPWVNIVAQKQGDKESLPRSMLGEIATLEAEFVAQTVQKNDVTQDRAATILSMVWKVVHDLEQKAYKLCNPVDCKAVVRIEATYEHTHEVNCSTGADLYPPTRTAKGELESVYGGSLTLVTGRLFPRGKKLRTWVEQTYVKNDQELLNLATSKNAVPTRRMDDMYAYNSTCFLANLISTTNFFALLPRF